MFWVKKELVAITLAFLVAIQPFVYSVAAAASESVAASEGITLSGTTTFVNYDALSPSEVSAAGISAPTGGRAYEWSNLYTVRARPADLSSDWEDLNVFKMLVHNVNKRDAAFVYFDCDGPIEVEITCARSEIQPLNYVSVHPKSYGIEPEIQAGTNKMTLIINPNQKLVVDPNGNTERSLHIYANTLLRIPTEADLKGKTVTYVDQSLTGTEIAPGYSATLNWGFDTDVVIVKKGFYNNSFAVKNNQTWYIEGDAVISGAAYLDNIKNGKLIGRGVFYRPGGRALSVDDSEDIYLEGVIVANYGASDGGGCLCSISNSKNVTVKDLKSISANKWGDAIDIFTSEDVTIEDCHIRSGDDSIAIYGPRWNGKYWGETGNVRNINVSGCILMPDTARPINIGGHGDGTSPNGGRVFDNITFRNLDILTYNTYSKGSSGDTAVNYTRLDVCDGNMVTNVFFDDIRIEDGAANTMVMIHLSTTGYGSVVIPGRGINNVYFKDIQYTNPNTNFSSSIRGYNSSLYTTYVKNITFENLKINGVVVDNAADAKVNIGSYVENVKFTRSGKSKYTYDPSIVPEDIWPDYYDYTQYEGVTATAVDKNSREQDPYVAFDKDNDTILRVAAWDGDPNSMLAELGEDMPGLTIDLGTARYLRCVRIRWDRAMSNYKYRIFVGNYNSDTGKIEYGESLSDEQAKGALNPKADGDYKRVKWNWLGNQRYYCSGRYVKIVPRDSDLGISEVAILGLDKPLTGAKEHAVVKFSDDLMSEAVSELSVEDVAELSSDMMTRMMSEDAQSDLAGDTVEDTVADTAEDSTATLFAATADDGSVTITDGEGTVTGTIYNSGDWFIYGSKAGQVTISNNSISDRTTTTNQIEVTGTSNLGGAYQFDLATKNNNEKATDKVIKKASLRVTPVVSKSSAKQTIYAISNEFTSIADKKLIAEYTLPRVGGDDLFSQTNMKELTTGSSSIQAFTYPPELAAWQVTTDITGDVVAAGSAISLFIQSSSASTAKTELTKTNLALNNRLNTGAVPLLYNGGETDFSKWAYPTLVFEYTDQENYKSAYNDFLAADSVLSVGTVTEQIGIAMPDAANGSTILLEIYGSSMQPAKIVDGAVVYNTEYVGSNSYANVMLTVSKDDAKYTKIYAIPVDYIRANTITFNSGRNPKGVASVTSSGTVYTNGTAYAKPGGKFTVDGGVNTGYKTIVTVTGNSGEAVLKNNDGTYTMPDENVNVSIEYEKDIFGTTRVAAVNSASVNGSSVIGGNGTNAFVIAAGRLSFFKFDLSGYQEDYITSARFTMTRSGGSSNSPPTAVFYIPNNNWTESSGLSSTFNIVDGNTGTRLNSFNGTNLFDTGNTYKSVAPDAGAKDDYSIDLSSASQGILADYYLGATSSGTNREFTEIVKAALRKNAAGANDKIITLMMYSPNGSGFDIYSSITAYSLDARPSLTITESSTGLSDSDMPTQIETIEDLEMLAAIINGGNGYTGKTVTLMNDIDLSTKYNIASDRSWTAIGTQDLTGTKAFGGFFEGNGYTIKGLYVKDKGITQGLFGAVSGMISNLTVEGEIDGGSVVGGIAAWSSGLIMNCHSKVNIKAERGAGGIVGTLSNGGTILNCTNNGNILVKDKETYAGGIAAHNIGTIKECSNSGDVTNGPNAFRNKIGGLAGYLDNGQIIDSDNTGTVKSESTFSTYLEDRTQNYVGGIVGYSQMGSIEDCRNEGSVSNGVDYAGGVAGYLHTMDVISKSYNLGNVSGVSYVGGVVGSSDSVIENSYNTASVTGASKYVGGAIGYMSSGKITNSYNTGDIVGGANVGGVIGFLFTGGTPLNCYYKADNAEGGVNGVDIDGYAVALTEQQFLQEASFEGWDFIGTWTLEGLQTPALTKYTAPTPTDSSVEYSQYGFATVTVQNPGNYMLAFVAYDDNEVISSSIQAVTFDGPGRKIVTPVKFNPTNAKKIKILLWNSIEGAEPVTTAFEKDM